MGTTLFGAAGAVIGRGGARYGPIPCEWELDLKGKKCGQPSTHLWIRKLRDKQITNQYSDRVRIHRTVCAQTIKRELCESHALCVVEFETPHASSRKVEF